MYAQLAAARWRQRGVSQVSPAQLRANEGVGEQAKTQLLLLLLLLAEHQLWE